MTITLEDDRLVCRFPDVHPDAVCTIHFQRTFRIPDDDRDYFLPPGLGAFPLRHLDDFADRAPADWLPRGGVVMPMHQAEALWISFGRRWDGYPCAVKIGTGKINAVSGEPWVARLHRDPQDYVVVPEQPWLDGYCVEKGVIRQFVATPLGEGHSVEEQLTGEARWGGLQIQVYPMKAARYEALQRRSLLDMWRACHAPTAPTAAMGIAPGGRMKQELYLDPHALEDWDQRHAARCFVTIANSLAWHALAGERPPGRPPTAEDYAAAGLPWFDYYDDAPALDGAARLAEVKSIDDLARRSGKPVHAEDGPVPIARVVRLRKRRPSLVREARF